VGASPERDRPVDPSKRDRPVDLPERDRPVDLPERDRSVDPPERTPCKGMGVKLLLSLGLRWLTIELDLNAPARVPMAPPSVVRARERMTSGFSRRSINCACVTRRFNTS
jgi:hypothetical protein